jgi:hypothetical protein
LAAAQSGTNPTGLFILGALVGRNGLSGKFIFREKLLPRGFLSNNIEDFVISQAMASDLGILI